MAIKIVNPAQPTTVLWRRPLRDETEYKQVKALCLSGRSISYWKRLLVPARTNTLRNFAEDFFFPSLYHGTNKVDSYAQRIIQNLGYFLVDVLTLPIRLLTCIPRTIYNALQPEHPFLTYLKEQGIDSQLIETGSVCVRLEGRWAWDIDTSRKDEITVHFATVPEILLSGEDRAARFFS